jgi:hypothetical protein
MELSKENVFKVNYTSVLEKENIKKKKWTSNLKDFIVRNKIITMAMVIFFSCATLNFVLIYNFLRILENM